MRPKAIRQAEGLYIAAIVAVLATTAIGWAGLVALGGVGIAAGVTAFTLGLFVLLVLLTTRRGSRVALWLLMALTLFGLVTLLYEIASGELALGLLGILNVAQVGLMVVGAGLLFRPAAREWFAERHDDWEEDA